MFTHILCASDLKTKSEMAFLNAIDISKKYNAKITLLNVQEDFMNKDEMVMSRVKVDKISADNLKLANRAKHDLHQMINSYDIGTVIIDILLREGKPSLEIVKLSQELECDLIIMGNNGHENISDYLLGTTAANVVNSTKIPVLVVPTMKKDSNVV